MPKLRLKRPAASQAQSMAVDRISNLPESILHHILSFLPNKDFHRTSVLSKTFLSSWATFPALVLHSVSFSESDDLDATEEIKNVLHRNIRQKKLRETYLEKFELTIPFRNYHSKTDYRVDEAICFAVTNGVKELNLDLSRYYNFPLITSSSNSITSLRLKGLELNHFDHLLAGCHAIKTLYIEECSGLVYFNFSSATITSITLRYCVGLQTIKIESPSLEKFAYDDRKNPHSGETVNCGIDISSCEFLKVLKLACASVTDKWVEDIVTWFRQLEHLSLTACHKLNKLTISNDSLRRLELMGFSSSLTILEIGGRSLESLNFIGSSTSKITFDTPRLVSFLSSYVEVHSDHPYCTKHLGNATLSISTNGPLHKSYFVTLREFIRSLYVREVLTLVCSSNKDLVIPEEIRGKAIQPCSFLKHVRIQGFSTISTELVDSLLWLFPFAQTFRFVSENDERMIEVTDNEPEGSKEIKRNGRIDIKLMVDDSKKQEDDLVCCSSQHKKCWRHSSKTLELKNFDTSEGDYLRKYFMENASCSIK